MTDANLKYGLQSLIRYITLNDNLKTVFKSSDSTITLKSVPSGYEASISYKNDDGELETKDFNFSN